MVRQHEKNGCNEPKPATECCGVAGIGALALCLVLAAPARAQVPVTPEFASKVSENFNTLPKQGALKCRIVPRRPVLDFTFQFAAGYSVECPLAGFEGKEINLIAYLRITPRGGTPVLFAEAYRSPALPPETLARKDWKQLVLEASGGFTVGEGQYLVEVLVAEKGGRFCRKQWTMHAARRRGETAVPLAMKPGTVSQMSLALWDDKLAERGNGLRVTILLDAAPMNWNGPKLRAWDRWFLLSTLVSLLQQVPCASVRVVAFNLEQQKEVFRQDGFDGAAFAGLSTALQGLELGIISAHALQRGSG